jgi:tetratricopeptide (TPR) repeat protein
MATSHTFVGRNGQLTQLQQLLDSTASVAHVSGISGVGKSWLVEKFVADVRADLTPVAVVDLRSVARREPAELLAAVSRQLAPTLDMAGVADAVRSFDERLRGAYRVQPDFIDLPQVDLRVEGNEFAGNVGDISGIKIENIHVSIPSDELQRMREQRTLAVTEAFRHAIRSVAGVQPVVVLDSFEHVAAAGARSKSLREWLWSELLDPAADVDLLPIKFVLVGQGGLGATRPTHRLQQALLPIALDKFDEHELRDYFERNCAEAVSERALAKIAQVTHSNPLCVGLVSELINETGWDVDRDERAFSVRATMSLVAEFLVQRILEGVTDDVADALRVSSAARQFDEQTLRAGLGHSEQVLPTFRKVTALPFVSIGDEQWRFHELVRDLIQADFERGDIEGFRTVHARLARFYGATFTGEDWTSAENFPEYVYHAVRADPGAKRTVAAAYSRVALRTRNGDLAVAIADATDGACLPETDAWVAYSTAVAQLLSGSAAEAQEVLTEVWKSEDAESTLRLLAASALATAAQRGGSLEEAATWSGAALSLADELDAGRSADAVGGEALVLGCLNDLGTILRSQIRFEEALEFYERARTLGRASTEQGARWEAAYAELYKGVLYTAGLNGHEIAAEAFSAAETAFGELHDEIGVVMAIQRQGWLARIRGDLEAALERHERAQALLPSAADPLLVGELVHSKANVLRQLGLWDAAAADYENARESFVDAGAERHLGLLEKDVGELQVVVGKARADPELLAEGIRTLTASLQTKLDLGQRREASVVLCLLGEARTELCDFDKARVNLTDALAIARETEVPINQARALAKLATLEARAASAPSFDAEFAEEARAYALSERFFHYLGEALIARAIHCLAWDELAGAARALAEGVRQACQYNADRASELVAGMNKAVTADASRLAVVTSLAVAQLAPNSDAADAQAQSVLRTDASSDRRTSEVGHATN